MIELFFGHRVELTSAICVNTEFLAGQGGKVLSCDS
jgi:hypothetical protein